MKIGWTERKKYRQRNAILKGIYEDNLVIIGKREQRRTKRSNFLLKNSIVILLSVIFLVLGNFTSTDLASVRENTISLAKMRLDDKTGVRNNLSLLNGTFNASYYDSFLDDSKAPLWEVFGLKVKTIIIDPGHGGEDPGAIGKMLTMEKDITLDIAKRLKEKLSKYSNYQIMMTRESDSTVSLDERIAFANRHDADLYISIHVNYVPKKPINIIETYYFGVTSDDETLRLAELENEGTQYTLRAFRGMIQKIGNTLKLHESRELATSIQKSLFSNISKKNKHILDYGIKTAPFVVLLGVDVPSVLTEVSCLSNGDEEAKLNDEKHREEIARNLEEGIVNYLNKKIPKGEINYAAN